MLYMVIETFRPGKAPELYRRFRDRGRLQPDDLEYVASWIDLDFKKCYQVMRTEREESLEEWMSRWDDVMSFEVVPVRTSAEAVAAIAPQL